MEAIPKQPADKQFLYTNSFQKFKYKCYLATVTIIIVFKQPAY